MLKGLGDMGQILKQRFKNVQKRLQKNRRRASTTERSGDRQRRIPVCRHPDRPGRSLQTSARSKKIIFAVNDAVDKTEYAAGDGKAYRRPNIPV